MTDDEYMARALQLAEQGRGRTTPNPMVGALVVSPDGVVVGQGYHARAGEPHAEVRALEAAGSRARGATLYCTLEPCAHTGRTGPCVTSIVAAGIARVVAATKDPNPQVSGAGVRYLEERGIAVEVGPGAEPASRLNRAFFTRMRSGRPLVIVKVAMSLDGRIAGGGGRPVRLTSAAATRRIHLLRAEVDAIGVGSGTILADDPLLTVREVYRARPLTRVIFDRRLRISAQARLFSTLEAGRVIILTRANAIAASPVRAEQLAAAGAILEPLEEDNLQAAMGRLTSFDISSILLEGGAELHGAAWRAGLVDMVHLYVTPHLLGDEAVPWLDTETLPIGRLVNRRVEACGPDVVIEGDVHWPH